MNEPEKVNTSRSRMRQIKRPLKDIELRLIAELMKNSHRSDREVARAMGVSQPTVSRIRMRLEKEGYVKEYTMIPNFNLLGYQIMNVSLFKLIAASQEAQIELKKVASKMEQRGGFANMIVARGIGMGKNRVFLTFYKNYADYQKEMNEVRQFPNVNIDSLESFLIDLNDDFSYRILSMKQIAHNLEASMQDVKA